MKGLIIYKSKYGATAQYAEWLGEELALPLYSIEKLKTGQLENAEFVLIGTSVYMGNMLVKTWLQKNAGRLEKKKIFLFVVSGGAAADKEQQVSILQRNIPQILKNSAEVFFLPGRLDLKKLSLKDRLLLRMGSMLEKDPVKKNAMRKGNNGVDKLRLSGLIKFVSLFTAAGIVIPNIPVEESYAS